MISLMKQLFVVIILCCAAVSQTTNISGSRTVEGNITVNGLTTVNNIIINGTCSLNGAPCFGGGTGGGGFGTVVTNSQTIQQVINSIGASGQGAPVVVPQGYTGSLNFTNPKFLPILNYTSSNNGDYDKNGVQPVDIFGVRHDGVGVNCNTVAGSTQVACFNQTVPFTQADVGKLIILYGSGPAGAAYGGFAGGGSITASGGTGGTNGTQALVSTDGGCTHPMRGWVTVTGGVPSGAVTLWFNAYGCTALPTQAIVSTVTGPVTLTGVAWSQVDLPTTIATVVNSSTITVTDTPATTAGGGTAIYGTDDYLALQAACNVHNLGQNGGHYTHVGTSLVSQGPLCDGNDIWIQGAGWSPLGNNGGGSAIVYAGKNPNGNDAVWNTGAGFGAKLTDMGLKGNSWARPRGLAIKEGNTPRGNGNSAIGWYDHLWIGWMWGDGVGINQNSQLSYGIFADVSSGNGDFNQFGQIYITGTSTCGVDGNNDQATAWDFRQLQAEGNYVGLCSFNGTHIGLYYTEFNGLDILMGSTAGGIPVGLVIDNYGGESSAQNIKYGNYNAAQLTIHGGGVGQPAQYEDPSNVMIDFSSILNSGSVIVLGDGIGGSGIFAFGESAYAIRAAKIAMPQTYAGVFEPYLTFNGITTQQMITPPWSSDGAGDIANNGLFIPYKYGENTVYGDPYLYRKVPAPWNINDFSGWQRFFGSVTIKGARPLGQTDVPPPEAAYYGIGAAAVGTAGTTVYNYQATCSDAEGNETAPPPTATGGNIPVTMTVSNGASPLNTTNYIKINALWQQRGCSYYNFYGDNGIGGVIGFLATMTSEQFALNGNNFYDQGQYTKDTTHVPPVVSSSGSLGVEGNLNVGGLTTLNNVTINGTCSGTGCGTGGGGGIPYPPSGIANSTGSAWGSSYNASNLIPSTFIGTLNQSTTGNAATATALAATPTQCNPGQFAIGITATGSANCAASGGGNAQVVMTTGNTPFTVKSPDLNTSVTFTLANGTNPAITSSTGSITFSDLIINDLAGTGTALLQTDANGNVSRSSTGPGAPYPPAGIPNSTGTAWGTSYSSSNLIPSNFIPLLNQPTTANAGTATALAATPTQCTGSQFATGIAASGNANCATPAGGGGGGAISALGPATITNAINNASFQQTWNWQLTGTTVGGGLYLGESASSSNTGALSALLYINTLAGSTVGPLTALAHAGNAGLEVDNNGAIRAQGTAKFIGPHVLPALIGAASLATDSGGNIVAGSASNSWSGLAAPTANLTLPLGAFTTTMNMTPSGAYTNPLFGLNDTAAANPSSAITMFQVQSAHANINPFSVLTTGGNGLQVLGTGNVQTVGTSIFIGPHQLPAIKSATSLATDSSGNIIAGTGGATSWSSLTNPTVNLTLSMGSNSTLFTSAFTGGGTLLALSDASTGSPSGVTVLKSTTNNATVTPLTVQASNNAGLTVDSSGNIDAISPGKFIGPVQLPAALASLSLLGTDSSGNIIAGTGGGGVNPLYTYKAVTNGYTITAADFATCVTFINSNTGYTINFPTTVPSTAGQCIRIFNYATGALTINHGGANVNGVPSTSTSIPGYSSSVLFSNSILYMVTSGSSGYYAERYFNAVPWSEIQGGSNNKSLIIGSGGSISAGAGGIVSANQINGAAVPPNLAVMATNASGQVIAGSSGGGMTWPTGAAGIPNYSGSSSWGTTYNASSTIPANFISTLNQSTTGTAANITATSNSTLTTLSALSLPYGQLSGTVPTWNQSTTGNAATATAIASSGTANQVWGMNAGGTAQGWQTPSGSSVANALAGGVLGSVPYQSAPSTTAMLAPNTSTNQQVLAQTGTGTIGAAPAWVGAPAINAANMTGFPTFNQNTTGSAAKLSGGAVGSIPYQSAASTTAFLTGNTAATDQVMVSHGTGSAAQAPTLSNAPALSATNMTAFPTLNQSTTGNAATATNISTSGTANQIWSMDSTGTTQGWQPAPSAGGPIYSQVFATVSTLATAGPIVLSGTGCSGNYCTAVTPASDTSYRLTTTLTVLSAGTSCTASGNLQFWISYTDPDSGTVVTNTPLSTFTVGGTSQSLNMAVGFSAVGVGNMYNVAPLTIRVKNGTALQYRLQESVAPTACTVQPTFTMRVSFFPG